MVNIRFAASQNQGARLPLKLPFCVYDQKSYSKNSITEKVNLSTKHTDQNIKLQDISSLPFLGVVFLGNTKKSQTEAEIKVELKKEMTRLYHTQACIIFHILIIH